MITRSLIAFLSIVSASYSYAFQTCGAVASTIAVCNDSNQCAPYLFNDRENLNLSGGWTMTNTSNSIGGNWNFSLKADGVSRYTLTNGPTSQVSYGAPTVALGKVAAGSHNASAVLDASPACTDSISFQVESTNVYGAVETVTNDGLIGGGACVKGATSNRLIAGTNVDIYANSTSGSLKSLGTVKANGTNVSSTIGSQCGPNVGYSLQLTERQQADFCNQSIWAGVKSADGTSTTYLTGSQNYLVPCALRPFVDRIDATSDTTFYVTGSNFKPGTKVDVHDGGVIWLQLNVTYVDPQHVTFAIPNTNPPSKCNLNANCSLTVAFYNPEGVSAGKWAVSSIQLGNATAQNTAKINEIKVETSYTPWAIGVRGSGFKSNAVVELYDNNGSFWSNAIGYAFTDATFISFQLPQNVPPSKCNVSGSCTITAKIKNPFTYAGNTEYAVTSLSINLPKAPSPSIDSTGVTTSYNPWAIWVLGKNFTQSSHIEIFDSNGSTWSANTSLAFGNSGYVTFQLPSNIPPSRCNVGKTCSIRFRVVNEYGSYAESSVTLPKQ